MIKINSLVFFVPSNDETIWFLTNSTIMKEYESRGKRAPKLGTAADMSIKTDRHSWLIEISVSSYSKLLKPLGKN